LIEVKMMKNKIPAILFVFALVLFMTVPSFSAEKNFRISIGVHVSGLWMPANKVMRDVYGTRFYPLGLFLRAGIGKNFALEVSTDYISETGTPLSEWGAPLLLQGHADMTLNTINVTGILGISLDRDFGYYLGAGISSCNFEETVSMFGYSETGSWNPLGFHFLAGAQRFWKNLGVRTEIRYLSAIAEGWQGDTNIGGFGVYGGFMIRFGI
jgi:opacity protein-like surface antigen